MMKHYYKMDLGDIDRKVIESISRKRIFSGSITGRYKRPTVMSKIIRVSRYAIAFGIAVGAFMLLLDYVCSIPIVYESQTYHKCAYVSDVTDEGYSCTHMPQKYIHVWVH